MTADGEVVTVDSQPVMTELTRPAEVRQSSIARFDACALSLLFDLTQPTELRQQASPMTARGTLFHLWVAKALEDMRANGWQSYPVEMGLERLLGVLVQADVPDNEVVRLPMAQLRWLRVLVTRWCENVAFDAANILSIEERVRMPLAVPDGRGGTYERVITGQPDVTVRAGHGHVIVVDWKAQPLDAKILTPTGWRLMGDLVVGDQVIGANGRAVIVEGVYPQGAKEVFDVRFKDGSTTRCTDDHLWATRWPGQSEVTVRTLAEIRSLKSRCYVPAVQPVDFAAGASLPLDPYLLGALLGDGTLRANGSVGFTSDDDDLVADLVLPAGVSAKVEGPQAWSFTSTTRPNMLRSGLRDLGLLGKRAWEKSVPQPYLLASTADRLAILRGLMDTDGSIDLYGRISFQSASSQLAEDVLWLVRSLGGRATYKVWPMHGGANYHAHCVYFRLPECPFRLARKALRWHPPKHSMDRGIVEAVPAGVAETQCIRVAGGLYVTDDFIVTHNSGWAPPAREVKKDEPPLGEEADQRLSDQGYAQQVTYGALVLHELPTVNKVTLREFYVMHGEFREATVERHHLERIQDVLATVVAQMDQAVAAGPESRRWIPTAGQHCGICPRPHACPIREWEGIPTTLEEAQLLAREWHVAGVVRKERLPLVKGWVDAHGPIPIDHALARREVGWIPNSNGTGKRFVMYEPEDAPASPFDERMEAVLRDR